MIPEIKNSKPVKPDDRIRFQCKRCGECCRHVKGAVVLDSLDGYRLAKHLGMLPKDFFDQYCDYFIIDEETHFPLYTLKTTGQKQKCIFLDKNRCTVRDARPSTCRMYPFWIEPTSSDGGININYCYERTQHQCGKPIRVKDWIRDHLDEEKRMMLNEEFRTFLVLPSLLHEARRLGVPLEFTERLLLYYRYLNYDTEQPFLMQFIRNNAGLIEGIKLLIQEQK